MGRFRRRGALLALAGLAAGVPGWIGPGWAEPAAAQTAASASPDAARLEQKIAELERAVAELKAEVERLRAGGPVGGGDGATVAELEKRIDALAQEIERLRIGEAAAAPAGSAPPVPGFGPAAAKVYSARRGVSIGGYGQMLYQNFDSHADDGSPSGLQDTLDLERVVLYFGYKWTDRLLFNSEVEFEHAVAGEGEPGETAVEFAYIDYRRNRGLGVRGGLLLVPMGFLTELHEPPIFHGATRPEVEQFILPSTWRENGAGVYGDLGPFSYRAYVVASLDASGFSAEEGIREGRQEGAQSKATDLALTARLDWNAAPGAVLGASVFTGGVGQGEPALGNPHLTLYDVHGEWNGRGWHVRGVAARGSLSDADKVSLFVDPALSGDPSLGTAIGSKTAGWYGEAAFNLLSLGRVSNGELSPFVRFEALDTQAETPAGFARNPANDRTVRTYGLTWRPISNVALKADVQDFRNRAGTGVDRLNLAIGFLF